MSVQEFRPRTQIGQVESGSTRQQGGWLSAPQVPPGCSMTTHLHENGDEVAVTTVFAGYGQGKSSEFHQQSQLHDLAQEEVRLYEGAADTEAHLGNGPRTLGPPMGCHP